MWSLRSATGLGQESGEMAMLESIAWTIVLMGLGAIIVLLVGVAIIWVSKEDI